MLCTTWRREAFAGCLMVGAVAGAEPVRVMISARSVVGAGYSPGASPRYDMGLAQAGEQVDGQKLVAQAGEPKLSPEGFCHGEPGSMYALPALQKRRQSLRRWP